MKISAIVVCMVLALLIPPVYAGPSSTSRKAASANSAFTVDLYRRLSQEPGNIVVSPLSIQTALTMAYAGAEGETAGQMAKVLHLPTKGSAIHRGFAALLKEFHQANGSGCELVIANSLWMQRDFSFNAAFLKTARDEHAADLKLVDFTKGEDHPRKQINNWVSAQTRSKIPEIIPHGLLNDDTLLVLANAVYFRGIWAAKFDKSHTKDSPFHLHSGQSVSVPTMHAVAKFAYVESDTLQMLELPYTVEQLSMVILLPKKGHQLADIEETLSLDRLDQLRKKSRRREVNVSLPKFKIESDFRLDKTLKDMGMVNAFLDRVADFSGITAEERLFIRAVLHKGYVEVDEEGTKAAAATAVLMERSGSPSFVTFDADHPFLFLIRHNPTGAILFLGRVANPAL